MLKKLFEHRFRKHLMYQNVFFVIIKKRFHIKHELVVFMI